MKYKPCVFLGGTCNGSKWRERIIPKLRIDYFNPVVEVWDEAAQQKELFMRENCDYLLYVITPKMEGVYSIAEVVDDSRRCPDKTLLCILTEDDGEKFTKVMLHSLEAVCKMVQQNGAHFVNSLDEAVRYLNN